MTHVILGLGSNKGDRATYLARAIAGFTDILEHCKISHIYESPAMLPEQAPVSWNIAFLNLAVSGDTELGVYELLETIKSIEQQLGRLQTERWGPREIDIDILLYGDKVIDDERITIPHPGMLERAFVMRPICDIEPDFIYPLPGIYYGKTMREIASILHMDSSHDCTLYNPQLQTPDS